MKITPIVDLDVPYFEKGRYSGVITLERGIDVPITILKRTGGTMDCILEDEADRVEVRQVPVNRVQMRRS